jgi:hypothetical protein
MIGWKVTVLAAVAAMFVSSIAGGTVLGNRPASADDVVLAVEPPGSGLLSGLQVNPVIALDPTTPDIHVPDVDVARAAVGVGETLVLAIADQRSSADASALLASINARFGDLQGFYIDGSANYVLTGVYIQESPDAIAVACSVEFDCRDGQTLTEALQPVRLRRVTVEEFSSASFPSQCGSTGSPPCQQDRYQQVLGAEPHLTPGHSLVVSAFRTKRGAEHFLEFTRNIGVVGLVTVQARKLTGGDVGLGQESHPDGSGALEAPLSDQESYQQ